jgi:hypothetical protein
MTSHLGGTHSARSSKGTRNCRSSAKWPIDWKRFKVKPERNRSRDRAHLVPQGITNDFAHSITPPVCTVEWPRRGRRASGRPSCTPRQMYSPRCLRGGTLRRGAAWSPGRGNPYCSAAPTRWRRPDEIPVKTYHGTGRVTQQAVDAHAVLPVILQLLRRLEKFLFSRLLSGNQPRLHLLQLDHEIVQSNYQVADVSGSTRMGLRSRA